jgi:hypothetical protein
VFNDKQLAARWVDSHWFYAQSQQIGFPLAAGSVIPATFRRPELEVPLDTPLDAAIAVGGIPVVHVQSIAFHALELLQSLVERRRGGEVGIRSIEFLEGDAVWRARDAGRWSGELFEAAIGRDPARRPGRPEDLIAEPLAILLEYRDGFRAAVIGADGLVSDYSVAVQTAGRTLSTLAHFVRANGNSFSCLVPQIEDLVLNRRPSVPIERTLLTSGIIDFMMAAREQGRPIDTPELGISYQPAEREAFCRGEGS